MLHASCLACDEPLVKEKLLCKSCLSHLSLLNPEFHCPLCFASLGRHACEHKGLTRQSHCFDSSPLSLSLTSQMNSLSALPELLSAFLFVQLHALAWQIDLISYVPVHFLRRIFNYGHPDKVLAEALAKRTSLPCTSLLEAISDDEFRVKIPIEGQKILIVGLQKPDTPALYALKKAGPCIIYGLFIH